MHHVTHELNETAICAPTIHHKVLLLPDHSPLSLLRQRSPRSIPLSVPLNTSLRRNHDAALQASALPVLRSLRLILESTRAALWSPRSLPSNTTDTLADHCDPPSNIFPPPHRSGATPPMTTPLPLPPTHTPLEKIHPPPSTEHTLVQSIAVSLQPLAARYAPKPSTRFSPSCETPTSSSTRSTSASNPRGNALRSPPALWRATRTLRVQEHPLAIPTVHSQPHCNTAKP